MYKRQIKYNAIDGLYIGGTAETNLFYQGKAYESDAAYYGVGWTYSGFDGNTPLNENNYMSQNTISQDRSSVVLSYASYYYPKTCLLYTSRCLENTRQRKFLFPEAATSEAGPLTSI